MQLYDKYPTLMKYFTEGIKNPKRAIAHSILFYGGDLDAQYDIAFEAARLLNCQKDGEEDCTCLNCNWINDRQHPAVMVISKVDNKTEDDETKTVISIRQSQEIKNILNTTSEFHRVFIFCDRNSEGDVQGLNSLNFQEETANSLLKIIEEPPSKTTFFFLTRDKNDLISTIISRSQSFYVPSKKIEKLSFSMVEDVISNYWETERPEAFNFSEKFLELTKTLEPMKVLEQTQSYMLNMLKNNLDNNYLKQKFIDDIKLVETAKKQLTVHMQPQVVFENFSLNLIK